MWLSEKTGGPKNGAGAEIGSVTMSEGAVGILTDAEKRGLNVYSQGGYIWRPSAGDEVLVIKCGDGEMCAVGTPQKGAISGMEPGEVYIKSKNSWIHLKNDGSIRINGTVNIEGGLNVNGTAVV